MLSKSSESKFKSLINMQQQRLQQKVSMSWQVPRSHHVHRAAENCY